MRVHFALLLTVMALLGQELGFAQDHQHASPEHLGTVAFSTSCDKAGQPQFNRAVALMHSFEFAHAIEAFNSILAKDPSCAISYWGIALSNWGNPFAAVSRPKRNWKRDSKPSRADGPRLRKLSVSALILRPSRFSLLTPRRRTSVRVSWRMKAQCPALSAAYPEDTEAAIFYALALAAAADPADKTYARQLKAGAMLEKLFAQYPDHPGLAHYIIHAYDVPPLAARAVGAARRYGQIAPSAPHALHMPSHTFTRVGYWQDSINTNIASAASARSQGQTGEELHASDYMVYAYLQTAPGPRRPAFGGVVHGNFLAALTRRYPNQGAAPPAAAYFAHAAIPARYCLERRAWADAAKLEPYPSPFPPTDAITYFARGLGAAHRKRSRCRTLSHRLSGAAA